VKLTGAVTVNVTAPLAACSAVALTPLSWPPVDAAAEPLADVVIVAGPLAGTTVVVPPVALADAVALHDPGAVAQAPLIVDVAGDICRLWPQATGEIGGVVWVTWLLGASAAVVDPAPSSPTLQLTI
jgi:hypothetical protein